MFARLFGRSAIGVALSFSLGLAAGANMGSNLGNGVAGVGFMTAFLEHSFAFSDVQRRGAPAARAFIAGIIIGAVFSIYQSYVESSRIQVRPLRRHKW